MSASSALHSSASPDAGSAAPGAWALECRGIRKTFPGVVALDQVDLAIRRGEIHGLVGQNGAGKSTLVKILTGVYAADAGEILLDGALERVGSPNDAEALGIAIVHQDQQLVPLFDVTRNIFLGCEKVGFGGLLDLPQMRATTATLLARVGAAFGPDTLIRDLSVAEREQVAIAGALLRNPRILILDEPTASLSSREVEHLFGIIRALRDEAGVTVIYISHYIPEVFRLVDRISVFRDGRLVQTLPVAQTTPTGVIHLMVGGELHQLYPKEKIAQGEPVLEIRHLSQGSRVHDVSLTLHRGEILGLAGLMGAGRTELALALVGALRRSGGEVVLAGAPSAPRSPRAAKGQGFALIPEDRRNEGLITEMSLRENLTLPNLGRWAKWGLLKLRQERASASELVRRLDIKPPRLGQLVRNLSGGNQQKVVIGRWLTGGARVFIFDQPTTGVDVGSRVEIYRQMTELARQGAAVLLISSDFEEVLGMSDRIAVMHKGRILRTLERGEADLQNLLFWATGGDAGADATGSDALPGARTKRARWDWPALLSRWGTVAGMLLALLVIGIAAPLFFAADNLFDVLKQGSVLALIALGLTAVLISGGFDMSVGAGSQMAANLAAGVILDGLGTGVALLVGVFAGIAAGLVNAAMVVGLRMQPFVATLGTMFVMMGITLLYNGGHALTIYDQPTFFFLGQGHLGPVPFVIILLAVVVAVLHVVFKRTRSGLHMYAVGENLAAARLRGISQARAVIGAFAIGGLVIGFAGVVLASYSYGASALGTGMDFLISALAAAFLGSTLSRTGELDIIGTTIAAIFLAALGNGLILMGVSNLALPGIQGLILVLSIMLGVVHKRDIGQVLIF
jgi:ribose transport system ATP-binding protein